jgi:hypothetical protein
MLWPERHRRCRDGQDERAVGLNAAPASGGGRVSRRLGRGGRPGHRAARPGPAGNGAGPRERADPFRRLGLHPQPADPGRAADPPARPRRRPRGEAAKTRKNVTFVNFDHG